MPYKDHTLAISHVRFRFDLW